MQQQAPQRRDKIPEFKVIVLGEARVGKSSIIKRFILDEFDPNSLPTTIGAQQAYSDKTIQVFNGGKIKINLWDTAGQEIFSSIVAMYYKQAKAAIIVFDLTDKATVVKAHKWIKEVQNNTETNDCKLILVGNKADKSNERQISTQEGKQMAEEYKIKFYETSAKNAFNVKEVFQDLAEELYAENKSQTKRNTKIIITDTDTDENFKKKSNGKSSKQTSSSQSSSRNSGGCSC